MFTPASLLAASSYLIELLPYHLLAYYPFQDRLRYPAWFVTLLIGLNMTAEFLVCCYCHFLGKDIRTWDFFMAVISLCIYLWCVNAEISKLLFIYILVVDYVMIARGTAIFLDIRFFSQPGTIYRFLGAPGDTMVRVIPVAITAPFMFKFLTITKERVLHSHAPQLWRTIWLIPGLTSFTILALTWNINVASVATLATLLARLSLLIMIFVIYYVLVTSLESLRLQGEAEERTRNQEQLLIFQRMQYSRLQKQIENTRQARHDLRQHLNLIQAYLDSGDEQILKEYLTKYGQKLSSLTPRTYCSNYAVDAVVRHYAEMAHENHIRFDSCIQLPARLWVDEPDICILFGNLLENALEACLLMPEGSPFIRIHARVAGEKAISITVDNSSRQAPSTKDGSLLSSKHGSPGTGTVSIKNIAGQYHGIADFKYEGGVFFASVFLNP